MTIVRNIGYRDSMRHFTQVFPALKIIPARGVLHVYSLDQSTGLRFDDASEPCHESKP